MLISMSLVVAKISRTSPCDNQRLLNDRVMLLKVRETHALFPTLFRSYNLTVRIYFEITQNLHPSDVILSRSHAFET